MLRPAHLAIRWMSAVLILAAASTSASAQSLVTGFRSAQFGMTEADVRKAIAKDFPSSAAAIEVREETPSSPRVLVIPLIRLNPGPPPAFVSYALGGGRLSQIDVAWVYNFDASARQRRGLFVAGERLRAYFEAQKDGYATVTPAGVIGPNSLLLHAVRDVRGGSMEATVDGVSFERMVDGKLVSSAAPQGPAALRISYRSPPPQ